DVLAQRVQQSHEAAVDIRQRETLQIARRDSKPVDQPVDEMHREVGMREDEITKLCAIDDGTHRRLDGHHRRRAWLTVERHLADVFAGAVKIDDEFAARLVARIHLDAAGQDDEQRIADIAFVDEHRVAREGPHDAGRRDVAQHFIVQRLERIASGGHSSLRRSSITLPSFGNSSTARNITSPRSLVTSRIDSTIASASGRWTPQTSTCSIIRSEPSTLSTTRRARLTSGCRRTMAATCPG